MALEPWDEVLDVHLTTLRVSFVSYSILQNCMMSSTKGLVPSFNINPRHWLEMLREQLKEDAKARVSSASGQSPFREAERSEEHTSELQSHS